MTRRNVAAWGGPAVLVVAALVPDLRPAAAVALLAGWAMLMAARPAARSGAATVVAWAAALPLGLALTWPWILGGEVPLGEAACADPLSVIALRRLALAVVILAVVAGLSIVHSSSAAELGLRRPNRLEATLAISGFVVLVVGGLVVGPVIARPFFGPLSFAIPPAAIVPALVFGVANGVLEEVLYRGVLQAWIARFAPIGIAIALQGLVFGIVHAGPEVQALLPVHIALLAAVGIAGGLVRRRTGSLAIPIGIHVGADVALYFGLACRPALGA